MKKTIIFWLVLVLIVPFALASVPTQISFQGILKDSSGKYLSAADLSVVFSIYADQTTTTALWTETQNVTVEGGVYTVLLGSATPIPADGTVFNGSTRYLGVKIGTDAEMTPRLPLISVPYAYRAAVADSAVTMSTTIDADTVDGYHASSTPAPSTLLPLNLSGYLSLQTSGNWAAFFSTSGVGGTAVDGRVISTDTTHTSRGGFFSADAKYSVGAEGRANGIEGIGLEGLGLSSEATAINYGGFFVTYGGKGYGVYGNATHTSGINYGVYGVTQSPNGTGVYGKRSSSADGIAVAVDDVLYLVPRSAAPTGTAVKEGAMYYDSSTHQLRYYNGTDWYP